MMTNRNTNSNTDSGIEKFTERYALDTPERRKIWRAVNDNWTLSSERLATAILSDLIVHQWIGSDVLLDANFSEIVFMIATTIYRVMPILDEYEIERLRNGLYEGEEPTRKLPTPAADDGQALVASGVVKLAGILSKVESLTPSELAQLAGALDILDMIDQDAKAQHAQLDQDEQSDQDATDNEN